MYKVINVETGESHGEYETLDRAQRCVIFDALHDWEIWDSLGNCIAHRIPGTTPYEPFRIG